MKWADGITNRKKWYLFNKFILYLDRNTTFSWINENHLHGRKKIVHNICDPVQKRHERTNMSRKILVD